MTQPSYDEYREVLSSLCLSDEMDRVRKNHRLPSDCYSLSDCEYLFTICARQHGEPFRDRELAEAVVKALLWRKKKHDWTLYCYCLMPDHLHFMVSLPQGQGGRYNAGARGVVPEGVLDHVAQFKSFTTSQIWWKQGGIGQLWQRSSHDRILRYNDSIDAAVAYVLENPVKKGLVSKWEDYPYAGIVDAW
jgi:REP element-mobilizing transposase RayT